MRLISAGSLVRAQSGPLPNIDNEFRLRLDGHEPGTEDNLHGKEVSERVALTNNRPAQQFFENYR